MTTTTPAQTKVALGYSSHADPFQCGREAAQMAKSQLPDLPIHLVLVLAPGNLKFKDFIEGVRLVTGTDKLVGIPAQGILSNVIIQRDAALVILLHSENHRLSIASSNIESDNLLAGITSLFSQIRQQNGHSRTQCPHQGILLFDNCFFNDPGEAARATYAEMDLRSWLLGIKPHMDQNILFVCQRKTISRGLIAIESRSRKRWGLGQVSFEASDQKEGLFREALTTALRDATCQLDKEPLAIAFLFLDFPAHPIAADDTNDIFQISRAELGEIPVVGLSTIQQSIRKLHEPLRNPKKTISVMVVPQ